MKNAKFFTSVMVLLFLATTAVANQGNKKVEKEETVAYIEIELDNENSLPIYGEGRVLITPSTNFLKTYKFQLTDDEMAQIDFGYYPNKISGIELFLESGERLVGVGFLNKAGNLSFMVRKNGSGTSSPNGWF